MANIELVIKEKNKAKGHIFSRLDMFTKNQLEAARFLGSSKYADENGIENFDRSHGGFEFSWCLLKGSDVF